jgi:SecD/SecF fusion protein
MRKVYIDFMGNRKWLFLLSGILLVVSIASLGIRGLNFSIDFKGGTIMHIAAKQGLTEAQVTAALKKTGIKDALVQTEQGGNAGFLVRTAETSTTVANDAYTKVTKALGVPEAGGNVSTTGASWGQNVTKAAELALLLSVAAILLYISLRFEYKMSITAVVALVHDVTITLGIYALVGREVSPNTIAALLTILGYSLYDTIVVFHRIRENSQRIVKQTFTQMANDSINQVLMRWINTGLSSIIPVVVLFVFGGDTLKDFAFALIIGLVSGAYSSVAIASPLYAMWKEREPKFQALRKKYAAAKAS